MAEADPAAPSQLADESGDALLNASRPPRRTLPHPTTAQPHRTRDRYKV